MKESSLLEFLGAKVTRCATVEEIPADAALYTVCRSGEIIAVSGDVWWIAPDAYYRADFPVFLNEEELMPWLEQTVAWDEGMDRYDSYVRRPGYQMRGRPVTPEQAFEIIRRTDNFFGLECGAGQDYLGTINFDSWWFHGNHYPAGYGWCHPDGRIGLDSITQKYPTAQEFVEEWSSLLRAFPFLDLCIVIWAKDEATGREESEVACGIHVHDGRVELLAPRRALAVFREYEAKWGDDLALYASDYHQEHQQIVCGEDYLKRCIAANGHDPEEVLAGVPDYVKHLFFHNR